MEKIKSLVSQAFADPALLEDKHYQDAIRASVDLLNRGEIRVCEKVDSDWRVNDWIKQAILLYFRIQPMTVMEAGELSFYDKIPVRTWTAGDGVRVVPHAVVRYGAFVEKNAILMPSYINIGAYVGGGTMVDTWATVGSCAQIGRNVHLSGGVGIGGVLEPVQARPVVIEDNCFVGSRCIVVEGVHLEAGVVLGAGTTLTSSTPIIDVSGEQEKVMKGRVPANSVVVPGTRKKKFPSGEYSLPCALIIGQRSSSTDQKTSLTQALRDFEVAV